jgi:hypothetical protein
MMSDRRGDEEDEIVNFSESAPDEDRLPWLEAVEEDEGSAGPGIARLIGAVVIGLAAIGLIVGGLFWLGNRDGAGGNNGDLIAAPEGDYKVRPDEPGGMNVAGEGDTAYAASEGDTPQGRLNTNAVAEAPVARPAAQPRQPAPQPQAEAQRPQPPAPQPPTLAPAAGGGATIQLGAFSSGASANSAWTALSGRFRYLAPLSRSVIPVQSGGRTLYRLRASGPGAADICRRLRVAGEDCTVIG